MSLNTSTLKKLTFTAFVLSAFNAQAGSIATRDDLNKTLGANLVFEDFEKPKIKEQVRYYLGPLNHDTVAPGLGQNLVKPGVTFQRNPEYPNNLPGYRGIDWNPSGYVGSTSKLLSGAGGSGGASIRNDFQFVFTTPVTAFGVDLWAYSGFPSEAVISIYDPAGNLLTTVTATGSVGGTFFGWENAGGIGKIAFHDTPDGSYMQFDNLGFGVTPQTAVGLDNDNDGILNAFDTDADNDGITDSEDFDDDNDGIPDRKDRVNKDVANKDSDNDGIPNAIDPDDDNDGISDLNEALDDFDDDNDGITDSFDRDDDNDGILDTEDTDDDNDGIPDNVDFDDDNDGISDKYDKDDDNDGVADIDDLLGQDSDNDNIIASVDNDDDNDGVTDDLDSDDDNDGVLDADEVIMLDTDEDGISDSVDTDHDNDAIKDSSDDDADNDGIVKKQDKDADNDGVPNRKDTDGNNDGVTDVL